ncbi:LysR family transcriptional regulator [Pseudonocardia acaciae]|uniref:LysR family transcriptional regulator n=1 Tax=Pseudonocardia acaciae TaxID=551276 RepID=UPI0004903861|nr:LysR family transcriptional regulator [Pseudonocardia acaciae]
MIDLRRLHVLRVVDQLGTITAAASSLHLTPSAVSQQLRGLSHDLAVQLLEPDGRRVRLTPAAHALLKHADDMAARWEEARGELRAYAEETGGVLRLAGFPSVLPALAVPAADMLRRREPRLELRLVELETVDAYERLLVGEVDIAITLPNLGGPTADDPRFDQQRLLDEPQDLLVPLDHPLAGRDTVGLEQLAHDDWVLPPPHSCDQYELVAVACATAGFTPKIAHEVKEWAPTIATVAYGFGVCLKPRLVPIPADTPVACIPLRRPAPRRRLLTCTRRGSREQRPIALGLEALAEAAAQMNAKAAARQQA